MTLWQKFGSENLSPGLVAVWPAALLICVDLISSFWFPGGISLFDVSPAIYTAAVFSLSLAVVAIHVVVMVVLGQLGERFSPQPSWSWLVIAALLGLSWQDTIMHGDGIRSHPLFVQIRIAAIVLAPAALAAFVWVVGFWERIPLAYRRAVSAVVALGGSVFLFTMLPSYKPFHGHLAVFVVGCATWALWPVLDRRSVRVGAISLVAAAVVAGGVMWPQRMSVQPQAQHFSHLTASLLDGMPLTTLLRVKPESMAASDEKLSQEQRELLEQITGPPSPSQPRVRGKNVLLVVLESTRADYWSEPALTPKFHQWKKQGLYAPSAIAQYPATPLAYGAMFSAQPPSVLSQSPYWGKNRLFDYLRPKFDDVILSRPRISWFEHNAITDFFVPQDIAPFAHKNSEDGLEYVRGRLEMLDPDQSYFGWVHLYEPHAGYEAREGFMKGSGKRAKYRSEIGWIDSKLGAFMDWFYESPYAKDTLLVVIGDHGEAMGEKILGKSYWGHHVHVHNSVNRVPLYVSGPGLPKDEQETDVQITQLDLMPTIFDFLGVQLPADALAQGRSVYELLENRPLRPIITEAFSIRGTEFFNFVKNVRSESPENIRKRFHEISTKGSRYSPKIGLQYGDHKLVYDRTLRRYWLYNTAKDPAEQHNLAKEKPEVLEQMKQRLNDWQVVQAWVVDRLND
jgi:hypothetical protein